MITKKCRLCGEIKGIDYFYKSNNLDGYNNACKKCICGLSKIYRSKNRNKIKEYSIKWNKSNKDKTKEYSIKYLSKKENRLKANKNSRDWCKLNRDKCNSNHRKWYRGNSDKLKKGRAKYLSDPNNKLKALIASRKWEEKHKIKRSMDNKQWVSNNKDKRLQISRVAYKKRQLIPKNKISHNIASNIRQSLKHGKCGRHWESLVGYTVKDLITHIEKQLTKDMNWNNYGRNGWHIDHIIPISWWEFESYTDREFKQCWSLANLQPLWEIDNIRKGNKYCYG